MQCFVANCIFSLVKITLSISSVLFLISLCIPYFYNYLCRVKISVGYKKIIMSDVAGLIA